MDDAPHPDPETGLYDPDEDGKHDSKTFSVRLLECLVIIG